MTTQGVPEFHESLLTDMERLAHEVKLYQEQPENRNIEETELLRRALRVATQASHNDVSDNGGGMSKDGDENSLPDYLSTSSSETKLEVEYLLQSALHKGIAHALHEAKKATPFILDAFHDALSKKLCSEMKERGML